MSDKAQAWIQWAELNRDDFSRYDGSCSCPHCRRYREAFEEWRQTLDAARAAEGELMRSDPEHDNRIEEMQRMALEPDNDDPRNACIREQRKEIGRLLQWVADCQSGMYVNCVYCGHRYGPREDMPVAMADILREHIEQCPEHPLSHAKVEIDRLTLALNKSETASGHQEADLAEAKVEIERLTVQRNTLATRCGDLQLEIERLTLELGTVCENWRMAFGDIERLQRCNESLSLAHAAIINGQNQEIERLLAQLADLEARECVPLVGDVFGIVDDCAAKEQVGGEIERLKRYEAECESASNLLTAHVGHGVGCLQVAAGVEAMIADLDEAKRLLREAHTAWTGDAAQRHAWLTAARAAGGDTHASDYDRWRSAKDEASGQDDVGEYGI